MNADQTLSRREPASAEAAGGKVVMPETEIGEPGFIALVEHTQGTMLDLHALR